jgi:hypothetical protein
MRPIIGIDLGTTNSLCAIFQDGAPKLIPNAVGDVLTPSVVGITDSGETLIGAAAKELRVTRPERCASCFKRFMGSKETLTLAGQTFTPVELSSLVLKSLRDDAAHFLGAEVTDAVITVPAYFNDDLYEWNHAKQLLRITAGRDETWDEARNDIFSEEFLLPRPLLTAIRNDGPTVLLVDETDKADVEIEGLLLEVLGDFQITVPELGTITATTRPFVVLTSNATRELSEALRRRCLFLHIDFPEPELEESIVRLQVPGLDETLVVSVVRVVNALRALPLRKAPSIAETIDWARTLLALGADILDDDIVRESLGVILKHADDVAKARSSLDLDEVLSPS